MKTIKLEFDIGDVVWFIDVYTYEHNEFKQLFYRIEKATVVDISIHKHGIDYYLCNFYTNTEYDIPVIKDRIFTSEFKAAKAIIELCKN